MVYKGLRTGVGGQMISLAGTVVLVYVSISFYTYISNALFGFLLQKWAKPVSFFIISMVVFTITKLLERLLSAVDGEGLAAIEKIGGILVSSVRAFLIFGVIGICLLQVPVDFISTAVKDGSKTAMMFVKLDMKIYRVVSDLIGTPSEKEQDKILNGIFGEEEK